MAPLPINEGKEEMELTLRFIEILSLNCSQVGQGTVSRDKLEEFSRGTTITNCIGHNYLEQQRRSFLQLTELVTE